MADDRALPAGEDSEALLDRIYHEARLRLEQGERDPFEDLARRHPGLAAAIRDLAEVHEAVAQAWRGLPETLLHGKYRVMDELGRGGQAVIYHAMDTVLDREVAIKMIPGASWATVEERARLLGEARALASMDHPHVLRVHEAEVEDDTIVVVLELMRGRDLGRWIRESGPLPARWAVEVVRQIALALQCIHERGLTHRDVKPENILVDAPGVTGAPFAKLCDLGLLLRTRPASRHDQQGKSAFVGTARYAAPEQRQDASVAGPAADIYSLGCVLREALTGSYDSEAHLTAAENPLDAALRGMLAPEPGERWSAERVATALGPLGTASEPVTNWIEAPELRRRSPPCAPVTEPVRAASSAPSIAWKNLDELDRAALERLAVFQGSFRLESAESLLVGLDCESSPRAVIARLIERGLVTRASSLSSRIALREGLIEPARRRAVERGSWQESRRRHFAHLFRFALSVSDRISGVDPSGSVHRLKEELPNIDAALGLALDVGDAEIGLDMALRLARGFALLGRPRNGRAWILRLLRRGGGSIQAAFRARAGLAMAFLAISERRWGAARAVCRRALETSSPPLDAQHRAALLVDLSIASRHVLGGHAVAMEACRAALNLLEGSPHRPLEAEAHQSLGQAHFDLGDLGEASRAFNRAHENVRETSDASACVRALLSRSRVAQAQGLLDVARLDTLEATSLAASARLETLQAQAMNNLGTIEAERGEPPSGVTDFLGSLYRFNRVGDRRGAAIAWNNLGLAACFQAEHANARACFEASRENFAEAGEEPSTALLLNEARLEVSARRFEEARSRIEEALARVRRLPDSLGLLSAVEALYELSLASGQLARACKLVGAADSAREAIGAPRPGYAQKRLDPQLTEARRTLGEEAYHAAIRDGRALSLEQASR